MCAVIGTLTGIVTLAVKAKVGSNSLTHEQLDMLARVGVSRRDVGHAVVDGANRPVIHIPDCRLIRRQRVLWLLRRIRATANDKRSGERRDRQDQSARHL